MSRRAEAFEHQTLRVGELLQCQGRPPVRFTERDHEALVRFNDEHDNRYFTVGHRRITLTQFVGYVEVGDLSLEILPKADRGAAPDAQVWRTGLHHMLRVALGMRLEMPTTASQKTSRNTLLDIVVKRFTEEVDRLVRQGLAKGYRDEDANGPTFRGRLLVRENLRENLVRADRFYVRAPTYDNDVLVNRALALALKTAKTLALSTAVDDSVARTSMSFPDVKGTVPADWYDRVRWTRSTTRYRNALVLARMILMRDGPALRGGARPVFALLFDMNSLWEQYVAAIWRRALPPELELATQELRTLIRWAPRSEQRVKPDIVIRERATGRVVLIADTKWKVLGGARPAADDLHQMFVYNELFAAPRAVLVYPTTAGARTDGGAMFASQNHGCGTLQVRVSKDGDWSAAGIPAQLRSVLAPQSAWSCND